MKLFSTNNKNYIVDFEEALFKGLPEDNGLFMPISIPELPTSFFDNIETKSLVEISSEVCRVLFRGYLDDQVVDEIVKEAIYFDAPLVNLSENVSVLELFHGPTLAFKDFGARFMAKTMGYFLEKKSKEIHILVATSGDTGGAVASGFYKTPGVKVTILYPSGKVSALQERQLTTLGENITALEVNGTFDDCQSMVKKAFLDKDLMSRLNLSSANSINIARLIPQSFYYFNSYARLKQFGKELVFSVPSGNFGNICAGMIAQKMGLPVKKFVASVNANDTFPKYLESGEFRPKPSVQTISNAMDVGNPSNFARIYNLYSQSIGNIRNHVESYSFDDLSTVRCIEAIYAKHQYIMDPHGAVGYLGLEAYRKQNNDYASLGVILHTAHPAKFIDTYNDEFRQKIEIPVSLSCLLAKDKKSILLENEFDQFKSFLLS